jgi:hypothetical protein
VLESIILIRFMLSVSGAAVRTVAVFDDTAEDDDEGDLNDDQVWDVTAMGHEMFKRHLDVVIQLLSSSLSVKSQLN